VEGLGFWTGVVRYRKLVLQRWQWCFFVV